MEESSSNSGTAASNVARAIAAALDWNSAPDDRKAAVSYLETVGTLSLSLNEFYISGNFVFQPLVSYLYLLPISTL